MSPSTATTISVEMYVLDDFGAILNHNLRCQPSDTQRGCTAVAGNINYVYPFLTDTITINLESHFVNGIQQGYLHTATGAYPYLKSVLDPISPKPEDVDDDPDTGCDNATYGTGLGGMSSAGAARWGRGNTSPVGLGDLWSIQWGVDPTEITAGWEEGLRILTHYYSGIVIRDESGNILTPDYRWTPLQVDWGGGAIQSPLMVISQTYTLSLIIQNTGLLTFSQQAATTFTCWWTNQSGQQTPCSTILTLPPLAPGSSITLTFPLQPPPAVTPGLYTLTFDAAQPDGFFQHRQPDKPWFIWQTQVCLGGCYRLYLPLVSKKVIYFFETFSTLHPGWSFHSEDTDRIPNYVRIYHTDGHDDNQALYLTGQLDLFSYTSKAVITITTPVSLSTVSLSFWVKRLDDTFGAYEVHLNGSVVASENGASQTWHQVQQTVSLSPPTRQLVLDIRVPAQLGYRHILLFDEVKLASP